MANGPFIPYKTVSWLTTVREDIPSGLSYEALMTAFERELGHWDRNAETALVKEHASWEKVQQAFAQMAGPHGLMIFFKIDQGRLVSLHNGIKKCVLYIVGNGVVAEPILTIDIRASLFVPFRVCLYDNGNPTGAIISYERPSSFLATLNQPALYPYGSLLDHRMNCVVQCILRNSQNQTP
ncbi:DUF302 domain-containing protein [Paenibacillus sp. N3.4]|uniref:DUF302 domain-containing protein n=1 Tax=Paenibacillus sp. N3.4 TaxID=2603222 RepID=UPI0011C84BE2|nr:DUF302 domain-containing protein [Paenibacillus sp. N3.4]TXK84889.1 DUF302 domain-containing protein [Paenibacillus sp. N3.4]